MFIGEFIKTTPIRKGGKQDGAEGKLNCNAGATETLVSPVRCAGAGQALLSYSKSRQRGQGFVALRWVWTGPGKEVEHRARQLPLARSGFLHGDTTAFWTRQFLVAGKSCPVYYRMVSNLPGLYLLNASSILLLTTSQSKCLQTLPMSPRGISTRSPEPLNWGHFTQGMQLWAIGSQHPRKWGNSTWVLQEAASTPCPMLNQSTNKCRRKIQISNNVRFQHFNN